MDGWVTKSATHEWLITAIYEEVGCKEDSVTDKVKCNICSKIFASQIQLDQHKSEKHSTERKPGDLLERAEDRLYEFLGSDGTDKALDRLATKAAIIYNAEKRSEASRNNALTGVLLAARSVTNDKNEIRAIVTKALPEHPIAKAFLAL